MKVQHSINHPFTESQHYVLSMRRLAVINVFFRSLLPTLVVLTVYCLLPTVPVLPAYCPSPHMSVCEGAYGVKHGDGQLAEDHRAETMHL